MSVWVHDVKVDSLRSSTALRGPGSKLSVKGAEFPAPDVYGNLYRSYAD